MGNALPAVGRHVGIVLFCIASLKGDAPRYEIVPVPGVSVF